MQLEFAKKVKVGQTIYAFGQPFKVKRIQKAQEGIFFVNREGKRVLYKVATLTSTAPKAMTAQEISAKLEHATGMPVTHGGPMPVSVGPGASHLQSLAIQRKPVFDVKLSLTVVRPTGATAMLEINGAGIFVGDTKLYADLDEAQLNSLVRARFSSMVELAKNITVLQRVVPPEVSPQQTV